MSVDLRTFSSFKRRYRLPDIIDETAELIPPINRSIPSTTINSGGILLPFTKTYEHGDIRDQIKRKDEQYKVIDTIPKPPLIRQRNYIYGDARDALTRNAPLEVDGDPRNIVSFARQDEIDNILYGKKVRIGMKPISMSVPDSSDIKWLDEFAQRLRAGESYNDIMRDPPLGRPQRVVSQTMDLNNLTATFKEFVSNIYAIINNRQFNDNRPAIVNNILNYIGGAFPQQPAPAEDAGGIPFEPDDEKDLSTPDKEKVVEIIERPDIADDLKDEKTSVELFRILGRLQDETVEAEDFGLRDYYLLSEIRENKDNIRATLIFHAMLHAKGPDKLQTPFVFGKDEELWPVSINHITGRSAPGEPGAPWGRGIRLDEIVYSTNERIFTHDPVVAEHVKREAQDVITAPDSEEADEEEIGGMEEIVEESEDILGGDPTQEEVGLDEKIDD